MKALIFLFVMAVSLALFGCSKQSDVLKYQKTNLPSSTWRTYSFTGSKEYYEFMKFNSDATALDYYTADISGANILGSKVTYTVTVTTKPDNIDSFEVFYPNGKSGIGFTTDNVNVLQYTSRTFNRVN